MNKSKIILFSGKSGHGKDFISNIFKEQLEVANKKVLIVHYADLLKFICKTFFEWDGNKDESGRTLLQYVGTDVIRNTDPNYWVDFIKGIIHMFPNTWDYILVPDTRFYNEINVLKDDEQLNVFTVRINRLNYSSTLTKEQQNHISETELDDFMFDYYVINDKKEHLIEQIQNIIEKID